MSRLLSRRHCRSQPSQASHHNRSKPFWPSIADLMAATGSLQSTFDCFAAGACRMLATLSRGEVAWTLVSSRHRSCVDFFGAAGMKELCLLENGSFFVLLQGLPRSQWFYFIFITCLSARYFQGLDLPHSRRQLPHSGHSLRNVSSKRSSSVSAPDLHGLSASSVAGPPSASWRAAKPVVS